MKIKLFLTIGLLVTLSVCSAQKNSPWTKWSWLIGEWKGEGSGQPGQGGGIFTFKTDLNDQVLIRKAHSEYPATGNKQAIVHDDLMIIYLDSAGNPSKAIYFDNEGHTITYSVSYLDKTIVLLSDKIPNSPIFRLVYILLDARTINTKFEVSQDGEKFVTYIEGKSIKIN